jgi:WD40 repeat protein
MPGESIHTEEREQRWGEVLVACLEALENGSGPDRQGLLARYPEFATELEEFFAQREQVGQTVAPLSSLVRPSVPLPCSFGDYELLEELGQGGMGVVYRARQQSLRRLVALKMIRLGRWATAADMQRFRKEAGASAQLDHPHIVPIYEVGEHDHQPYFSMKLIEGGSLTEAVSEGQAPRVSKEACRRATQLVGTVARAVHHAHQRGILHRDLKPSNILLDAEGRPHVTDFGLAKRLEVDSSLTQSGLLVGTPSHMAPEQATAQRGAITTASDIYGLGAVLYVLLTGRPPFRGDSVLDTLEQVKQREPRPPSASNRQVDRDLETICLKCLQKEPRDRYDSALALAEDLEHWLAGEPIRARPTSRRERSWRWCRRNPVVAGLTAAVLLLFVAGVAGVSWNYRQAEAARQDLEANLYFARIALAHRELTAKLANPEGAEDLLDLCPPDRRSWEWHYLKRLWRVEPVVLRDPGDDEFNSVAFSPDGQHLAAACRDKTVKVWDLKTGQVLTLRGHEKDVFSVAFSATDGRRLASASNDKTVRVWDLTTRTELFSPLPGRETQIVGMSQSVTFSSDGRWLAATSEGDSVRVWDATTGQLRHTLPGHEARACLAFSPNGRLLASGNAFGIVRIWDAQTGRCLFTLRGEHIHPVGALAFSPDGRQLAAGSFDRCIDIWDATTGDWLRALSRHTGFVLGLAFSPDGSRLASTGEDRSVRIWDVSTGQEVLQLREHTDWCQGLAFSPDGRLLASASRDRTIRLWDATPLMGNEGRELFTFRKHNHEAWCLAISPDGRRIASAGLDPTVYVWDAKTGQVTQTFSDIGRVVFSVGFSPDGHRLAAAGRDDVPSVILKVWDVQTGQPVLAHRESREVFSVAFSPDGRWLALGIRDGTVKLCDARSGDTVGVVGKHEGEVRGLAFRPDGQRLASAGRDRAVKVWDVGRTWRPGHGLCTRTGCIALVPLGATVQLQLASWIENNGPQPLRTLPGAAGFWSVAYSPDGHRLLSVCADGQLTLWAAETGQEISHIRGQVSGSHGSSAAFSPDGRWIASAAEDCTVKLWDAGSLACQRSLRGHLGPIRSIAVSQKSDSLVTSSADKTVKVWDLTHLNRNLK